MVKTNGVLHEAEEISSYAQKESILEQIEADLYSEKVKKGKNITKSEAETIISQYGIIQGEEESKKIITTQGNYEIPLSQIVGWKQAE